MHGGKQDILCTGNFLTQKAVRNNNRSNQQKSNFARAALLFVHFFAVVLYDYNVKLPETSQLHVLWRICGSSSLLFTAAHFHLALEAASISHFVSAAAKFPCCSSNKKKMSPLFFYLCSKSLSPFFSLSFPGPPPTFSFSLSFSCSLVKSNQWSIINAAF